ncbi:hypothetical protein C0058_09965 [Pseudomonas sp. NC02]|nr:hypothetical protein C0058_09965 [Pseudomonas sp. NC02]
MWERACSRIRCNSHLMYRLIYRIREQARSHICFRTPVIVFRDIRCTEFSHSIQDNSPAISPVECSKTSAHLLQE